MQTSQTTLVPHSHPAMSNRDGDAYIGRRGAMAEVTAVPGASVHGDLKVLRSLAAKQNATRRMGKNRRSHGRNQSW